MLRLGVLQHVIVEPRPVRKRLATFGTGVRRGRRVGRLLVLR